MFRASSCPSSGATTTAVAASGLPSERGDSSAVGRGRAGRPNHDQQHCYHQVCVCVCMFSCTLEHANRTVPSHYYGRSALVITAEVSYNKTN